MTNPLLAFRASPDLANLVSRVAEHKLRTNASLMRRYIIEGLERDGYLPPRQAPAEVGHSDRDEAAA